jgi:hypothetical protein
VDFRLISQESLIHEPLKLLLSTIPVSKLEMSEETFKGLMAIILNPIFNLI